MQALTTKGCARASAGVGRCALAADAHALLAAGADRVVVGTAAFARRDALERLVHELGDRLVVAIDVREGRVVTGGWTLETELTVDLAVDRCIAARVQRLLATAVDRDGTLGGPDLELLGRGGAVGRSRARGRRRALRGGSRRRSEAGCEGRSSGAR